MKKEIKVRTIQYGDLKYSIHHTTIFHSSGEIRSFYSLDDEWRSDYPILYDSGSVGYDNPEYFPKRIIRWCNAVIKNHGNRSSAFAKKRGTIHQKE